MNPGHRLAPGQKGFIVTCNDREKEAVKEVYNILNEYAEKLFGPEEIQNKTDAVSSSDEGSEEEDIEKAIASEVQSLKAVAQTERRFQNCQTGARNCIFIKTTVPDPTALAHGIFSDLLRTKKQKSRYALRLLPVVGTCKGNLKSITTLAEEVLGPFFKDTKFEITYMIMFKARNNNGVGRESTISALRQTVTETFPDVLTRYCPVNPELTILIEVMCGVGCIAVVKDFMKFRKYNLVEVVSEKSPPAEKNSEQTEEKAGSSSGHEKECTPETDSQAKSQYDEGTEGCVTLQHETESQSDCAKVNVTVTSDMTQQQPENKTETKSVTVSVEAEVNEHSKDVMSIGQHQDQKQTDSSEVCDSA